MTTTTTTPSTISLDVNLSSMIEPFFSQIGLTVDNLVVTASYDEYSNLNVLNISSNALSFGSIQVVSSMNITASFNMSNSLVNVSGLADIVENSFGVVSEEFLAQSIESLYQEVLTDNLLVGTTLDHLQFSIGTQSGHSISGTISNSLDYEYELTLDGEIVMSGNITNNNYPEGFIPPENGAIVTQALETYVNQSSGELYTVPTGGWTIPEGWLRDDTLNHAPVVVGDVLLGEVIEDANTAAHGLVRVEDVDNDYVSFSLDDGTIYRDTDYGTIYLHQIAYAQSEEVVADQAMPIYYNPPINLTGEFNVYDATGVYIGGSSQVIGLLTAGGFTDSAGFTSDGVMDISSDEPFFGNLWAAHNISYDFNAEDETMTVDMLFDWGDAQNIAVEMRAGVTFNSDGTATISATDGDGDGVLGSAMLEGPFAGLSAAFNFELSSEDGSDVSPENLTLDPYIWPPYPVIDFIDWSYQLNNDSESVQSLGSADSVIERFTIVATDEHGAATPQEIEVTVHGQDEATSSAQIIQIRNTDTITKAKASIDEFGEDYTSGNTDKITRFELWVDATELISFGVGATEVRGYQFNIDWNESEMGALNFPTIAGTNIGFNASNPDNAGITFNSTLGEVAFANATAVADTNTENDGPPSFVGAEHLIGSFYINPNPDLEDLSLSLSNMMIVTDTENITPDNYTDVLEISSSDSMIYTDSASYLDNISLHYYKDGADTGVHTWVDSGEITFPDASLDFDYVKISNSDAYTDDIMSDDAVDILRDIVNLDLLTEGSISWHAADVNNDGSIGSDDAVDILRHIVHLDEIDTFDLIDNMTGERVTTLDSSSIDMGNWSIVANGDVDQSGGFIDGYSVLTDIV